MLEPSPQQPPLSLPPQLHHKLTFEHVFWQDPPKCCLETIHELAPFNTMMVCGVCHNWIKIFDELKPFRNFLEFSNTRARKVVASYSQGRYYALYKSYSSTASASQPNFKCP